MGNCIFCKKRRISEDGIPKCARHGDLRNIQKYMDPGTDYPCSKFEDSGFMTIFDNIGKRIDSALKILQNQR